MDSETKALLSTEVKPLCECQLRPPSDVISLCPVCHVYRKGKQEFVSVSTVIKRVFPTDYSGVDPAVLEHARVRGERVDAYFSEYLRSGTVIVQPGEWREVLEYLERLVNWSEKEKLVATKVQEIVYSQQDGIAGMLDIRTNGAILDLKCVSKLQPNYALQLGAYLEYGSNGGEIPNVGIIHLTKAGVRLMAYDPAKCLEQWRAAKTWYLTMKELQS